MPVIFRPARPSRRVVGGRHPFPWSAPPIRSGAGSSAGVATASAVGIAIKSFIGATAGAATVNGIAIAIKAVSGSAAGAATVAASGGGLRSLVGVAAGAASVDGRKLEKAITSTGIIQKPVDYALAGDQMERRRLGGRAMRHAFGE